MLLARFSIALCLFIFRPAWISSPSVSQQRLLFDNFYRFPCVVAGATTMMAIRLSSIVVACMHRQPPEYYRAFARV